MAIIYLIALLFEVLVLFLLKRRATSRIFRTIGLYPFAILFLPGTFVHEMSHFLTALFLLVPVGQVELMPKQDENFIKMGSVPIGKTDPIRRSLIGLSPIIFGIVIIFVTTTLKLPWYVHAFIAFEIGNTMFSSKKDLEGVIPIIVVTILIYLIFYFLGVRINLKINEEIFRMADLFLLVPIGIDFVFLI